MKFSRTAFFVAFPVHVVGTLFLFLAAFGNAMSSFSRPGTAAQDDVRAIEGFGWLWSFGPMLLQHVFHISVGLVGHLCWSLLVAVVTGFVVGRFKPKRPSIKNGERQRRDD